MSNEISTINFFGDELEIVDAKAREQINNLPSGGGSVDLSEYAKISDVPTKLSQLTNDKDFAQSVYVPADVIIDNSSKRLFLVNYSNVKLGNGIVLPSAPTQEQINIAIDKAIEDGKVVSGGINSTAKNLLQIILQNAIYTNDQSANITALMSALSSTESGGGDTPIIKTYTITSNLTNCTNSNISINVDENSNYIATISPSDGYTLTGASISITMGGSDVTSTVYNNGVINIEKVTGDVIITVSAIQIPQVVNYTITNKLTNCTSNNNNINIEENKSYTSTITASNGYTLTGATVIITMGGTDVTSTVYNNGIINISKVTGNIVITVSAVQEQVEYTIDIPYTSKNSTTTTWSSDDGTTEMSNMAKAYIISDDVFDKDTEIQVVMTMNSTSYGSNRFGSVSTTDEKCYYGIAWYPPKEDTYFTSGKTYTGTYTVKAGYKLILCGWSNTSTVTINSVKAKA